MNINDNNTRTHIVLTKGTIVSHYRIVSKIGAGGMGEGYPLAGRTMREMPKQQP